MRYHFLLIKFLKIKTLLISSTDKDVGKKEFSYIFGGITHWCNLSGGQYGNIILNTLKMWLPFDQPTSLLRLYSKEIIIRRGDKNVCTRVFATGYL